MMIFHWYYVDLSLRFFAPPIIVCFQFVRIIRVVSCIVLIYIACRRLLEATRMRYMSSQIPGKVWFFWATHRDAYQRYWKGKYRSVT
jgi:hypothetical protein